MSSCLENFIQHNSPSLITQFSPRCLVSYYLCWGGREKPSFLWNIYAGTERVMQDTSRTSQVPQYMLLRQFQELLQLYRGFSTFRPADAVSVPVSTCSILRNGLILNMSKSITYTRACPKPRAQRGWPSSVSFVCPGKPLKNNEGKKV